jgi:uncharacterized SAM-binding protein YcdF (DUF218 family)
MTRKILSLFTTKKIMLFLALIATLWATVVMILLFLIHDAGVPTTDTQPADTIIILGSGLRRNGRAGEALTRRSIWASEQYHAGLAPTLICTGGIGERQTRSEADACYEILQEQGVPADAIFLEEMSKSTEENAIYAKQIMDENGLTDAILVTDSFHMLRASWIFDTQGITHQTSPVPRERMRLRFYIQHTTREVIALHWQAFKQLLNLPVTHVKLG